MAIVKEKMLIQVNGTNNNNKFYHLTLSDTGQIVARYGRVGATGTTFEDKKNTGEHGFNKVINSKIAKGYKETNVLSVGEEVAVSSNENLSDIAKKVLLGDKGTNSVLEELVDTLVRLNNHDILETSGGLIKVNSSGLITTPLGLIDKQSIAAAKNILASLERTSTTTPQYLPLLEEYLSLIPQKVPSKKGWYETFFNNENTFASQADFLKQLGESLALREERKKAAIAAEQEAAASGDKDAADALDAKYAKLFKLKIDLLEDKKEFKRIERMFDSKKAGYHSSGHLKLKRVFVLNDEDGKKAFDAKAKKIGNVQELWHGTRAFNVLSIMRRGLIVAPVSGTSIRINGRLFAEGCYFSDQSTKSLNYAFGYWDGGPRDNRCFMFLADVAMGNTHHAERHRSYQDGHIQRGGKFDSIFAEGGKSSVMNNEMIVWNTDQINMKYLCEFGV